MRSTVSLSPLPQYCAAIAEMPAVTPKIMKLSKKLIRVAWDTAERLLWSSMPIMIVSDALTRATIRCWAAMGSTMRNSLE